MAKKENDINEFMDAADNQLKVVPIWRDFVYDFGTMSNVQFKVRLDEVNEIIYSGLAVGRAGENTKVVLNDIISDYLHQANPFSGEIPDKVFQHVSIETDNSGVWTPVAIFQYDWSYKIHSVNGIYSEPVTGRISPKQFFLFSASIDGEYQYAYFPKTGNPIIKTVVGEYAVMKNNLETDLPTGTKRVEIDGVISLDVTEGCERYVLYYVNAIGGWDSLLVEGSAIRTDGIGRKTYKKTYRNTDPMSPGRVNYQNNIIHQWELHTGIMTGDQGSRMHHLLESTMVYLHDMDEGTITPVVVKNSECVFKDYKNNGGQMFEYSIQVEEARDYMRK